MTEPLAELSRRIDALHRRCRVFAALALLALPTAIAALVIALARAESGRESEATMDLVRTRRLELVDDANVVRAVLAQDGDEEDERRSRASGLILFDGDGAERGGFVTLNSGEVVLGMDAPHGVGAPMRDRIGLIVGTDGGAEVRLIDNRTAIPVRLVSRPGGESGIEFLDADLEERVIRTRRLGFDGESRSEQKIGG